MLTLFKRNTTADIKPSGEPTRATIADEQKLYDDKHPGFPQYLPWVEYFFHRNQRKPCAQRQL